MNADLLFYIKNYLDFIFYFIIFLTFILGLIRGLIKELFKFLAVVFGILISYLFTEQLALYFSNKFEHPYFLWSIICSVIIYFIIYIIIIIIGHFISKITDAIELSSADKIFGGILGLLKGIFVTLLIFYILNFIPDFNKFAEFSFIQKQYVKLDNKFDFSSKASQLINNIKNVKKILDNPESQKKFIESDDFKELKDLPAVKNIVNDTEIQKDFENKNWDSLLSNKKIINILKNEKIINKIKNIDISKYLDDNPQYENNK